MVLLQRVRKSGQFGGSLTLKALREAQIRRPEVQSQKFSRFRLYLAVEFRNAHKKADSAFCAEKILKLRVAYSKGFWRVSIRELKIAKLKTFP